MTIHVDTQYWDEAYASGEYRKHWEYAFPSPELVTVVAAGLLKASEPVLDIGCGAGREAVFLAKCGYQVIGVDISLKALAIAKQYARKARVEVDWRPGSIFELPVDTNSIGFINDRGLLHMTLEKHRRKFAAEIKRVLKPGGVYLVRRADETWGPEFTPITPKSLGRNFPLKVFTCGPVLPIQLISNAGALPAKIAILTKN